VARGLAAKQVARQLRISPKTVERHKTRIFTKLRVPNQAAAVRAAMDRELGRSDTWISFTS
jgi:DNA-binding NarL/FixJ family response regulator